MTEDPFIYILRHKDLVDIYAVFTDLEKLVDFVLDHFNGHVAKVWITRHHDGRPTIPQQVVHIDWQAEIAKRRSGPRPP